MPKKLIITKPATQTEARGIRFGFHAHDADQGAATPGELTVEGNVLDDKGNIVSTFVARGGDLPPALLAGFEELKERVLSELDIEEIDEPEPEPEPAAT